MTPSDFCVWLDGFLAVERSTKNLPKKDVEQIKQKLSETRQPFIVPTVFPSPFYPPTITDGISYNSEASDFARITCESGPGGSG